MEIALDRIKDLGDFMEVEAKGDFKNVDEARKACLSFLDNLGVKDADRIEIKKGYPVMLLEKI